MVTTTRAKNLQLWGDRARGFCCSAREASRIASSQGQGQGQVTEPRKDATERRQLPEGPCGPPLLFSVRQPPVSATRNLPRLQPSSARACTIALLSNWEPFPRRESRERLPPVTARRRSLVSLCLVCSGRRDHTPACTTPYLSAAPQQNPPPSATALGVCVYGSLQY
ncbi:hypothetical protein CC78DRAFT_573608 [Lojkania enalia]|uniref:Uncharacterized protein n=1 Tax=Lojkania enalia TaxID=147567 RepID=A0A9P4TQU2_9PLEO|nr:hypothetical protein CC78DRAFT_573608 [Didymosphaeria enalia]